MFQHLLFLIICILLFILGTVGVSFAAAKPAKTAKKGGFVPRTDPARKLVRLSRDLEESILLVMKYVAHTTGIEPRQEELAAVLKSYFTLDEVTNQLNYLRKKPPDRSSANNDSGFQRPTMRINMSAASRANSFARAGFFIRPIADAIAAIASKQGAVSMGSDPVDSWLDHRNNVPDVGALIDQGLVVDTIEVAAAWDRLAELFDAVCSEGATVPGMIAMSGHVSHCYTHGANIYFTFVAAESDPSRSIDLYDRIWSLTMRHTRRVGGTIAHHHGIGRVRKDWLGKELGASVELIRRLKRAIDPHGIMNPGVLID